MSLPARDANPRPPGRSTTRRWHREDTRRTLGLLLVLVAMHAAGWGVLLLLVLPRHLSVGDQVFGLGLGVTAYTLGMRHAFDADHIAAIDNTTRKLMAEGQRPVSVGFWFALGHSSTVVALAALVSAGARLVGTLVDHESSTHRLLAAVGTGMSGGFLYVLGLINLVALLRILRVARTLRRGGYDEGALDHALDARGLLTRLLSIASRSIRRPAQMYLVGLLFGVGFDTATEVTLMMLTGTGAAQGLPWYALLVLPLLFAAGMSLFDSLDGTFMNVAYAWAFANPVRKIYYNLTITALSVGVALGVGSIELVTVVHDRFHLTDVVTSQITSLDLGNMGYLIAAIFVVAWAVAVGFWKLARVEERWAPAAAEGGEG